MNSEIGTEEFRWQIVKAMLDEYPALKEKVKNYIKLHAN
jgi:hypothetical protein